MSGELRGCSVAFLVAPEGAEQIELTSPWEAVEQAGGKADLISVKQGSVRAVHHLDSGDEFSVDRTARGASAGDYQGLVLPGGVANPDYLRGLAEAVRLVGDFITLRKPVAAICHAPWMLIEANVVRGRRVTSYPSLATDLRNAGAEWIDAEAVVDNGVVTSRYPDDLPAFNARLVQQIAAVRSTART